MNRHFTHLMVAAIVAGAIALPATAWAAPARPPASPAKSSVTATDEPTKQAIALQRSIIDVEGEQTSLDNRINVTTALALKQTAALDSANADLAEAQKVYDDRIVELYESGDDNVFAILLDSSSYNDLIARFELLTRILESDNSALQEVAIVASQAEFQAGQLDSLRSQADVYRTLKDERTNTLTTAQTQQQSLNASLSLDSQALVEKVRTQATKAAAAWRAATVPVGTRVKAVAARVLPYGPRYLSSQYHYRTYRTTRVKSTAVASWYGSEYDGLTTASGELFNASDFTCAHETFPLGTWLALSRYDPLTKSTRRVVVVVNDRGPYVTGRGLDVSRAAADALGLTQVGIATLNVEIVKPVP